MEIKDKIKTYSRIIPMIYAYTEPGVTYHDGWTKIGYTEKQTVEDRIKQQTHTADIKPKIEWTEFALYKNSKNLGEPFTDHDFHSYLTRNREINRKSGTEWFEIEPKLAHEMFDDFSNKRVIKVAEGSTYTLRNEQQEAVNLTKDYFETGSKEFLWNAKPRFGKTLATYDLIQEMGAKRVLIVTNRPSIANSWLDDFNKFVGWRGKYLFVSESNIMEGKNNVYSRYEYNDIIHKLVHEGKEAPGFIAFESLQGLKGSKYFGGNYDKLHWLTEIDFDLLVIDESHEGVDTQKTLKALDKIKRNHTLFLSGTPFKAISEGRFGDHEIYNWSYADEQETKNNWDNEDFNPYERLPKLNMFTYQMSSLIEDELKRGANINEDDDFVDYAFDLNEFFKTKNNGKFEHEEEVKKFIKSLTTGKKYPFSTPELRNELAHTLWILNRVDSAKALAKLLKEDETFKDYEIVVAAGDGIINEEEIDEKTDKQIKDSFEKVKRAIANNDKTITLSVGKLTVGVTIPEWSGVLMLSNMNSPAAYMQAAFRAQNPYSFTASDGKEYRKENAYVFDFDPARTLIIFDEFANSLLSNTALGGTSEQRKEHIKRLLNFFPVIGEDSNGEMVELDATQVLTIPRKLKSTEVVRRGFLSNFLFKDISRIFGAPREFIEILDKLPKAKEQRIEKPEHDQELDKTDEITVNDNGEVEISNEIAIGLTNKLLGDKIYKKIEANVVEELPNFTDETKSEEISKEVDNFIKTVKDDLTINAINPIISASNVRAPHKKRIIKQFNNEVDNSFNDLKENFIDTEKSARAEMEYQQQHADSTEQFKEAKINYENTVTTALNDLNEGLANVTKQVINEQPVKATQNLEKIKKNEEKREVENSIRDHLRGFARTIPSFIMAYGDSNLNLKNFDDYTEDDVFEEVTGITEEEFRKLRDGYDYYNEETGETIHYDGFFDEVVFNDSIQEFLNKREELANYFDDKNTEDIFDYIPPQKTNQIFTPKWVVKKMVDELEENDPGCFGDPNHTFADLYMKSGLYIAEIVKRLFQNEKMKEVFPDDRERIKHILENQVYGMAPSRIIYLIATNYILGFDEELKSNTKNFVQADSAEAAKNGTLQELVDENFGI